MSARKHQSPEICPACGAEVPPRARACPECGADEKTGWNEEETQADGLDLYDESFDYEKTLENEGLKPRVLPPGLAWYWWALGIILIAALGFLILSGKW
jgi:hypothetical protein